MKIFKNLIFLKLFYVFLGLSLAISSYHVYATWDDAKTGGAGTLGQAGWNAMVDEIHTICGVDCDAKVAAEEAISVMLALAVVVASLLSFRFKPVGGCRSQKILILA